MKKVVLLASFVLSFNIIDAQSSFTIASSTMSGPITASLPSSVTASSPISSSTMSGISSSSTQSGTSSQSVPSTGGSGVCADFENGNMAPYQQANINSTSQWIVSSKRVGNPDTGVPRPPTGSTKFLAISLRAHEVAAVKSGTVPTSASPQTLTLKVYEATANLVAKICQNDPTVASNCQPVSGAAGTISLADLKWKDVTYTIQPGTTQIFLVADNSQGKNLGAVGFDQIKLQGSC